MPDFTSDYRARGFVNVGRVFSAGEVQHLLEGLARTLGPEPAASEYGVLRHDVWRRTPSFEEALPRLAAIARDVLDVPEVVLFQDNVISKPPGTRGRIEWHQDFAYWPLASAAGITLWVALDDADVANGCLCYVPGSHHAGERAPTSFVAGPAPPSSLPPLRVDEAAAVPALARAGEVLAHSPLVAHVSGSNASDRERRAWSLTFVLPDARWDPGHAPHPYNFERSPRRGEALEGFPRFPR